jgi:hypothetical protein
VVFYGSSITQGGCAENPGLSYAAMLGRALKVDFINLGFSGNGLGEPAVAQAIAEIDAAAFVLDHWPNPSLEVYRSTMPGFVATLRAPVRSGFPPRRPRPISISRWRRSGSLRVSSSRDGVGLGIGRSPSLMASECYPGIRPRDWWMACIRTHWDFTIAPEDWSPICGRRFGRSVIDQIHAAAQDPGRPWSFRHLQPRSRARGVRRGC